MLLIKGNKGKGKVVDRLEDEKIVIQYTKSKEVLPFCNYIIPDNISDKLCVTFIFAQKYLAYCDTLIIYTDKTEKEIQELKELLKPYDNKYMIIITCTED